MTVLRYLPSAFDQHRREGEIIGRIVIEYGEIEWDLCLLLATVIGDQNAAVKAMYRTRGETPRIMIADGLARCRLPAIEAIRDQYSATIKDIKRGLDIRNKYAHANWVNTPDNKLGFLDIEGIAKTDTEVDLRNLAINVLTLDILEDQQRFFNGVNQNLRYLNEEIMTVTGKADYKGFHYINPLAPPKLAQKRESGFLNAARKSAIVIPDAPPREPAS